MATSSPSKDKGLSKKGSRKSQRTPNSLNVTEQLEAPSEVTGRVLRSRQNREDFADSATVKQTGRTGGTRGKASNKKGEHQLPSPPESRTGRAGGGLFASASSHSDEAEGSTTGRKRTRTLATTTAPKEVASPNPKARKQLKTRVMSDAGESDAEERNARRETSPRKSNREPPSHQHLQLDDEGVSEVTATPARRVTRSAPKTEKIPTRAKALTKTTSVNAASLRSRRKSAPNGQRCERKLRPHDLDAIPEPDSDGDDPLLLVSADTWVPVPWKPMFGGDFDNVEVKTEVEEGSLAAGRMAENRHRMAAEPTWRASTSPSPTPPAARARHDDRASSSSQPSRPIFPEFLIQEGVSDDDDDLALAFDCGVSRDPDSSFSGMDIEGDEPVHEFTVPLRTASPPSRRRRSSAVSQREETPGTMLEHSPGRPRQRIHDHMTADSNDDTFRPISTSATMSFATLRASRQGIVPSASVPSITRASPGLLRIAPATPPASVILRRSRALSITSPLKTPFKQTLLPNGSPAYPSPRYMGTELGSLSPEKGRGPSRGRLPRLDEFEEESMTPLSQPLFQAEKLKDEGGREGEKAKDDAIVVGPSRQVIEDVEESVPQFRPRGGWMDIDVDIDADSGLSVGAEDLEGDPNSDEDYHPDHDQFDGFDHYEQQEDEEERRNSLRIERELTEDFSGEEEDGGDRMEEDEKPATDQQISLMSSSSPVVAKTMMDVEPKEEDENEKSSPSSGRNALGFGTAITVRAEVQQLLQQGRPDDEQFSPNQKGCNGPSAEEHQHPATAVNTTSGPHGVGEDVVPDVYRHLSQATMAGEQSVNKESLGFRVVHGMTNTTYEDGNSGSESESDDDGPPVVEITSKDPMVAARAAAILKLHHDYIEDEAKMRRRRRGSEASVDFGAYSSSFVSATPPNRRSIVIPDSIRATPVPSDILRRAEREVSVSSPVLRRLMSLEPSTPQAGPSRFKSFNASYTTPVQPGHVIPEIIIDPASSRPSDYDARASSESDCADGLIPLSWSKADWKTLERCLLLERRALADEEGLDEDQVDVASVDVEQVIWHFLHEVDVDASEEGGDWAMDKIRRRCQALVVRHTRQASASVPLGLTPGSPMLIPFSPAPSRQSTPISFVPNEAVEDQSTEMENQVQSFEGAPLCPSVPLPPSLLAPHFCHLYEEAATIAGFNASVEPTGVKPTLPTSRLNDSPSPAPTRAKTTITRSSSTSRIPLPPSRLPRPTGRKVSAPTSVTTKKRTEMLPPPPPPARARRTPPPLDTPSTTNRVLGFLGLGNILRLKPAPVAPATIAGQKRKAVTPQPILVDDDDDDIESHRLTRKRVQPTSPIAELLRKARSKEDLNHIEPEPPRPIPRPPHPKDLVSLSPVPPNETPRPSSSTTSRRSSTGSVKDLIRNFETLEDMKDVERNRIRQIIKVGRRVVSGEQSIRRTPSNLSTASVISADDLDPSTPGSRGRADPSYAESADWSGSFQRDSSLTSLS
ncbi:hypothetical protein FRB98_002467 [Tulasnella sp. 332]|nr:hypothetical protein FRB98_002467 [Tulasnella sp. 332]